MTAFRPERVVLAGRSVRLEPLTLDHVPALWEVLRGTDVFRYMPAPIDSPADMRAYVEEALDQETRGLAIPFAQVETGDGKVVGSTRFGALAPEHRRVEIGWTWIGPAWQRTAINTEAKYLLLRHAFETWGCARVELKTDARNTRSIAAMERIGAVREGTLRSHMTLPGGARRDSVYFSIVEADWPDVKRRLEARLARR